MSLIADALKRAQEQRKAGQTDDKARRMLSGAGPLRVETRDGPTMTRPLGVAMAAVMVAAVVLVGSILMTPRSASPGSSRAGAEGTGESGWLSEAASAGSLYAAPTGGEEGAAGGEEPEAPVPFDDAWPGRVAADGGSTPDATAGPASDSRGSRAGTAASASRSGGAGSTPDRPRRVAEPDGGRPAGIPVPDPAAEPTNDDETSSFRIAVRGSAQERTAEQYFVSALAAHRTGDLERAASLYRSAIELRPRDAELWNNLGAVYRRLSRPAEALAAFRSAVEAMPSYAPAWSNLGLLLDGLGRDSEAVEAFREALRQDPDNAGAKVNLANKYHALGMPAEARSLLREVLRDDPTLPEAHYALARVLEDEGEAREAARHYRLFLEVGRGQFPALEERVTEHLAGLDGGGP